VTRRRAPVLVSAHRCGAGDADALENSLAALEHALAIGADFVEFDVQRCRDGALVVAHDDWVRSGDDRVPIADLTLAELTGLTRHQAPVLRYEQVLDALAGSAARAHVDLKFTSPGAAYADPASTREVVATALAVDRLGAGNVIVTTLHDRAVRALRDWSDEHELGLLVGLSLGRSVAGLPWHRQLRIRLSELLPRLRYLESRANLVVANHALARAGVARFARRRGLPLLVWTVDTPGALRYWMHPGRAWLVTTNHPRTALEIRDDRIARLSGRLSDRQA
jgi:glycerophosphoryl diester phosphodiesterase